MTASLPILYSFRRCPYAMRARMALLVSAVEAELREVALGDKPADMVTASPKATVPVLVLADGRVIDESLAIMRWALEQHDPEDWLGAEDPALIQRFDGDFKHHLDRYKYPDRFDEDPVAHRDAGLSLLRSLETRLASAPHLSRDDCALSDIAIMPFVRQFAAVDQGWFYRQRLPNLHPWLARLTGSPLFEQAMQRAAPWRPGDAPIMLRAKGSSPPPRRP